MSEKLVFWSALGIDRIKAIKKLLSEQNLANKRLPLITDKLQNSKFGTLLGKKNSSHFPPSSIEDRIAAC